MYQAVHELPNEIFVVAAVLILQIHDAILIADHIILIINLSLHNELYKFTLILINVVYYLSIEM